MKHMKNDKAGVSPVIATLILVLIAVAAGVAFFAWQSGWQDDATQNVGDGIVKTTIEIGGSSTVFPFTAVAAEAYMAENPTVQINYQSGGSGAGTAGVAAGVVDIGAASSSRTQAKHFPDHPDVVITEVARDAVAVVVKAGNNRLNDIDSDTAILIFSGVIDDWNEVPVSSAAIGSGTYVAADYEIDGAAIDEGRYFFWATGDRTDWEVADVDAAGEFTLTVHSDGEDLSYQEIESAVSAEIIVYDRADKSGTEECFNEKLLGRDGSSIPEDWADVGVPGNQEMLTVFDGTGGANAIGFLSTGIADSDVKLVTLNGVEPNADNIGDGSYAASRPILYMHIPSLTNNLAIVEDYINFCMQPRTNQDLCDDVAFISWYEYA